MTIALIGDLHGNMPAVEALDKDLKRRGIDTIYCLGDLVGKGPSNAETMDWALERCQVNLRGNWDEGVGMKQFPNDTFYHRQLGEKRLKKLAELPLEHHFTLSGRKIRLLHGRPVMDEPYFIHENTKDLEKYFEPDWDVVGYADVHRQGLRVIAFRGILFNTGSVGNGLGVNMVQYAIMDGGDSPEDPLDIRLVTLPYDREKAVRLTLEAEKQGRRNAQAFINEIRTGVYDRPSSGRHPY